MPAFQLENTSLWKDVSTIVNSPANNTFFDYTATIHTALEDYKAITLLSVDIVRDYHNNIGDQISAIFVISFGDYVKRFYPFKNNLELTIAYIPKSSNISKTPNTNKLTKQRYKMVFLPNENPHIDVTDFSMMDKLTLDHMEPVNVRVQLLDRSLEPLRIKMTSGIYLNVKPETLLRTVLGNEANNILVDGKPSIDSIDIYPPDNTDIRKHVVIPNNTHVLSMPTFMQEKMMGVYSAGIGNYLQTYNSKKTLFVYPLYNTQRFKTTQNTSKIIFYFMPKFRYKGIDNTYTQDGNIIKVVCSSDKHYMDDGETGYMDKGVGFIQADARSFMGKPVILDSNNVPQGSPAQISTYVANTSRDDGLNYAPNSQHAISANPFLGYSEVTRRNVSKIDLMWDHSDSSLIYPGMPCQFVFLENGNLATINGVVIYTHTIIAKTTKGLVNNLHVRNTFVSILAERRPKITQADTSASVQSPMPA